MESQTGTKANEVHNSMYTAVRNSRRRSILTTLIDRASVFSEQELALALTATEQERSVGDISDEEIREIRTDLRHVHLPLLEDSGLVTWEKDEGTITTTDHAAFDDPRNHPDQSIDGRHPTDDRTLSMIHRAGVSTQGRRIDLVSDCVFV